MRNVRVNAGGDFPTTAPTKGGGVVMTDDGSVLQAVRSFKGGLAWAVMFAGPILASVRAVSKMDAPLILSGGNNVATCGNNGTISSVNGGGLGGYNQWALGDRVLIPEGMDGGGSLVPALAAGVWDVTSLGAVGAPFTLARSLDARTSVALPAGRSFVVLSGYDAGKVYTHATANLGAEPGAQALRFLDASGFQSSVWSLFGEQLGAGFSAGALVSLARTITAAAGPGDVALFNSGDMAVKGAPRDLIIVGASMNVTTAGADPSSVQLRSAAAGGGTALSGPISTAALGKALEGAGGSLVSSPTVPAGSSLFARFSDRAAVGTLYVLARYQ